MHETNLRSLDLNLLVALDALMTERHVTRAAERIAMSQPAMSRALGRLRKTFHDPLLVRAGSEMVVTARGRVLAQQVSRVLDDVRNMLTDEPFEPAIFSGRFKLLTVDYASLTSLPSMLEALLAEAPEMRMEVEDAGDDWPERLQAGEADVVLGVVTDAPAGIYQRAVLEDRFACIMRQGHPLAGRPLDLDLFLAQRHVLISSPGRDRSAVDAALERLGQPPRNIALRLPHFMASTAIIAATDLVMTLPQRIAAYMARHEALEVRDPPVELEGFTLRLLWHQRCHDDPAHHWMRERGASAIQNAARLVKFSAAP
ncbi:MAG TPA: LysR family transcriptional regulator [Noviherbaspirillum sp.]|uniref:LysR family transcriptional regulator n=1 Tax=Noviherbaspirillum sp. TaxID=1926288 RepID=UPI002D5E00D3|nr:LysR family transcriptional regulator [Noviherbaspirillum sp.]HYD96552.1 LysR family transcriptional regulator [Noviherbaspirillum sp.]